MDLFTFENSFLLPNSFQHRDYFADLSEMFKSF